MYEGGCDLLDRAKDCPYRGIEVENTFEVFVEVNFVDKLQHQLTSRLLAFDIFHES